jgi:hypothetical protein
VRAWRSHTVLHIAKTPNVARILLEARADPNARTDDGYTPLYFLSTEMCEFDNPCHLDLLQVLLDFGDPGLENSEVADVDDSHRFRKWQSERQKRQWFQSQDLIRLTWLGNEPCANFPQS